MNVTINLNCESIEQTKKLLTEIEALNIENKENWAINISISNQLKLDYYLPDTKSK